MRCTLTEQIPIRPCRYCFYDLARRINRYRLSIGCYEYRHGLVVSSSQIIANDIYRDTLAPKMQPNLSQQELDSRVLTISRWSTVGVLVWVA